MFYVSKIFDKVGSVIKDSLYVGNQRTYTIGNHYISCNFSELRGIYIDVYDSDDDTVESYLVSDLLKIIADCGVEIKGISIQYYISYIRNHTASPSNFESILSLKIRSQLLKPSKEYMHSVAKSKLNGINVDLNGYLRDFNILLLKGDSLVLPDNTTTLSFDFNIPQSEASRIAKVFIPSTLDLKDYTTKTVISRILRSSDSMLIVNGDLRLTPTLFRSLHCNIFVRGKLSVGNFKNFLETEYFTYIRRRFKFADKDYIYILDTGKEKIFKSKNDGSFIF